MDWGVWTSSREKLLWKELVWDWQKTHPIKDRNVLATRHSLSPLAPENARPVVPLFLWWLL